MAEVIHLRRTPAANDPQQQGQQQPDALDALGPEPVRPFKPFADFALMYRPLWTRLILWPSLRDVQHFAFWFMVGGLVGAVASCTHGG